MTALHTLISRYELAVCCKGSPGEVGLPSQHVMREASAMERTAGRHAAGGRHQAPGGLPARPAAGAERARAHLEYRGAHRAGGPGGPGRMPDMEILRRVRDALASGMQP